MARLLVPEGYTPTRRSEIEIRANIVNIPIVMLASPDLVPAVRKTLQLVWWEEMALQQRELDELEAHEENKMRAR